MFLRVYMVALRIQGSSSSRYQTVRTREFGSDPGETFISTFGGRATWSTKNTTQSDTSVSRIGHGLEIKHAWKTLKKTVTPVTPVICDLRAQSSGSQEQLQNSNLLEQGVLTSSNTRDEKTKRWRDDDTELLWSMLSLQYVLRCFMIHSFDSFG